MLNKTKLVFDPAKEGDVVASFLKSSDGSLISKTAVAGKNALDVSVVNNGGNLFSKPFNKILVLSKNEFGDPLLVKSQLNNVDVQLITLVYDEEEDLVSMEISDL